MLKTPKNNLLFFLIPLSMLILSVSIAGIFVKEVYLKETYNWQLQALAQDYFDMIILLPVMILSFILMKRGLLTGFYFFLGTLIYTVYTFVIYCFAVHFNFMFLVYCAVLGISVYAVIYLLNSLNTDVIRKYEFSYKPVIFAGTLLIIFGAIFYFLWFAEIIPSLNSSELPAKIIETGGVTNPVHVLDISLILPAFFITGILLLKRNVYGFIFAPSLLAFSILMSLTISWIVIYTNIKTHSSEYTIAIVFLIQSIITIFAIFLIKRR